MPTTFFSLPGELRNRIYELSGVVAEDTITCSGFDPVRLPAVTQVCKQMRKESISMYYAQNTFALPQAVYSCDEARRHAGEPEGEEDKIEFP
jgi:hypothetical protein